MKTRMTDQMSSTNDAMAEIPEWKTKTELPVDAELDTTGSLCPLPVLKTRKFLKSMAPGEKLKLITSDPAAVIDIPHYCNESGHHLIAQYRKDDLLISIIEKS